MTGEGPQANALSEMALALAMAFFSIMVLTLVSMGGIAKGDPVADVPASDRLNIASPPLPSQGAAAERVRKVSRSAMLIFFQGRYLDADLKAVDPQTWRPAEPAFLAVPPSQSLAGVMAAKARLGIPDITITTLDKRWLTRLKELNP